jgi:hypothetical protein
MAPAVEKSWHGEPLFEMLALKPEIEIGIAAGRDVVKDCKDAERHGYLAATTMISTL